MVRTVLVLCLCVLPFVFPVFLVRDCVGPPHPSYVVEFEPDLYFRDVTVVRLVGVFKHRYSGRNRHRSFLPLYRSMPPSVTIKVVEPSDSLLLATHVHKLLVGPVVSF